MFNPLFNELRKFYYKYKFFIDAIGFISKIFEK